MGTSHLLLPGLLRASPPAPVCSHPELLHLPGAGKRPEFTPQSRNRSRNRTGEAKNAGEPGARSVRPHNRQSLHHSWHEITQPVHNPSAAAPDHLGGAAGRSSWDLILVLPL